jgi:ABC-type transport system substrate-binding protein
MGLGGSWEDAYPDVIESLHADAGNILRIEFTQRPNLSVWPYGVGLAPVMAKHVWASVVTGLTAGDLASMSGAVDVSGGPLILVTASDTVMISKVNPGYPGSGVPDVVEYHVYDDEETLVAAVVEGQVDSVLTPKGLTPDHLASIVDDDPVTVLTSPANGVRYLGFNLKRAPMSDPDFRKALALLLDREDLAATIPNIGQAAFSMIPKTNRWFDQGAASSIQAIYQGDIETRLDKALVSLAEAGYAWTTEPSVAANGDPVPGRGLTITGQRPQPLTILTAGDEYDPARPEYVQKIADTLAYLGFDVRPVVTDDRVLENYENAYSFEDASDALWMMERTLATDLPYLVLYSSQVTEIYRSDRVAFDVESGPGGLQGRLGGIGDVRPVP